MSIFKAYDIRGTYPNEINEEIACDIGRSIATFLKVKTIVVGRDMRENGNILFEHLTRGITDQGVDVIDIGIVSTPMCYFACAHLKAHGSIMITASHNPAQYNGFKITRQDAIPVSIDTGIKEIENIFLASDFPKIEKKGNIIQKDIKEEYRKHVLKFVGKLLYKKIVIDAGNGMAGLEVPIVFKDLPLEIIPMYFELDGNFPHHEANPLKEENLRDIKRKVLQEKADLGIAFDGDADRIFFITEEAETIPSDFITCLLAKEILKEAPGETILYDLRSSWITKETIEQNNGKASMSRVGHALIKEQMRKVNGIFAGELSGHYYFRENYFCDSGIIAALKIIELLCKTNKRISDLIMPLKKYYATGEINFEVEDKDAIMNNLKEHFKQGKISFLDGIRIEFKDWWFNVRPSNTEPLLRLNLEAKTRKLMEERKEEVVSIIKNQ